MKQKINIIIFSLSLLISSANAWAGKDGMKQGVVGEIAGRAGSDVAATSSPVLINVIISGNTAGNDGGGIYNESSSPVLTNVTISGNTSSGNGGGMYNTGYSSPELYNSIVLGNSSGMHNDDDNNDSPTYAYSLVQDMGYHDDTEWNFQTHDADDVFIDYVSASSGTDDATGIPATDGDFRLKKGSPAIGAGDRSLNSELTDLDGNDREVGKIDIGAYESSYLIVRFDTDEGATASSNQYVALNNPIIEPDPAPTKPDYIFDGWFDSSEKWDFDSLITTDITLMAQWKSADDDLVGNAPEPSDVARVWSYNGNAYFSLPSPARVSIFTISGTLYDRRTLPDGNTSLPLPPGVYIIHIPGMEETKIVVN